MAKYTQLLAEYLQDGGALPAVFDDIDGFTNLFVGKYIEREIGFETPDLFAVKLDNRAQLVIPAYKERIMALNNALAGLDNPTKVRERTGGITRNYGQRTTNNTTQPNTVKVTNTDLPTGGNVTADRVPNSITETDNPQVTQNITNEGYSDGETYNAIKDTESGATISEALQYLQAVDKDAVNNLMASLLNEFESLFMRIW